MRLEDVDIKITHNILDSLFSRLMADKISSIGLLKSLREASGGLYIEAANNNIFTMRSHDFHKD